MCCGLGDIKPIDSTFSTNSANHFCEMVEDEKVYVKILHIDSGVSTSNLIYILLVKYRQILKANMFLLLLHLEKEGNG